MREEENRLRDEQRKEEYERRRAELYRQRKRSENIQKEDERRKKREEAQLSRVRNQRRSALKKSKKSMPPSMERALRKRLLQSCSKVGGVNWKKVFRCHEEKEVRLTLESFRSSVRREGRLTIKNFDNPSIRDVFHSIDVGMNGAIGHDECVAWLNLKSIVRGGKMGATAEKKMEQVASPVHFATSPSVRGAAAAARNVARPASPPPPPPPPPPPVEDARNIEAIFMDHVRHALRDKGKDEKAINVVVGSLQYMLDNEQGEKARAVAGKTFGTNWPKGLVFPLDAPDAEEEEEEEEEEQRPVLTHRKRQKISVRTGSLITNTTAFGGGRSLPWENPSTPTKRDEFGNYTTTKRNTISKVSTTGRRRRMAETLHGEGKESTEEEMLASSSPPVFVAASRRGTLFGRETTGAVINAKTSRGQQVYAKQNAERRSAEKKEAQARLEILRRNLSTNVEEVNRDGEVLFDAGSLSDPNYVENVGRSLDFFEGGTPPGTPPPLKRGGLILAQSGKKKSISPLRTPRPIDLSIFSGSRFKVRSRKGGGESSAVKRDKILKDRYSKF